MRLTTRDYDYEIINNQADKFFSALNSFGILAVQVILQ
jgi:hypothetical protein